MRSGRPGGSPKDPRIDLFTAKSLPTRAPVNAPAPDRLVRRERDFGIGYGRSSGYGNPHRYTSDWAQPRFRCS